MVQTMSHNLHRVHDLWGVFLAHAMELLNSGAPAVRAAAVDALDRIVVAAIGAHIGEADGPTGSSAGGMEEPPFFGLGDERRRSDAGGGSGTAGAAVGTPPTGTSTGSAPAGEPGDGGVEHMLTVALESMYRESGDADTRKGLLKIVMHVLQRHGEQLSRGWLPLLRLLEAIPKWSEAGTVTQAYGIVEVLTGDFLATLPKDHLGRSLQLVRGTNCCSLAASGGRWNSNVKPQGAWRTVVGPHRQRASLSYSACPVLSVAGRGLRQPGRCRQRQPHRHQCPVVHDRLLRPLPQRVTRRPRRRRQLRRRHLHAAGHDAACFALAARRSLAADAAAGHAAHFRAGGGAGAAGARDGARGRH